jgi:hypothetical protein
MFQPDLFSLEERARPAGADEPQRPLDLPAILERLTVVCERPRYSFMVLNLIAQASAQTGSAGPYVHDGSRRVPVRDWLCDALIPVAQRDPRRQAIAGKVRQELEAKRALPADPEVAKRIVDDHVRKRVRQSGRTNVSRAVSELVRAGFVRHHNRGAQRQAVYTITDEARRALHLGR